MRRTLLKVAALALCTTALTACSLMGGDDDNKAAISNANGSSAFAVSSDLNAAIVQAQTLRTSGDLDGATRVISQLMLAAPDDARIVGEYGKILVQRGRADDAAQFLRRAVELEPSDWTLYSALGVAYDQIGDPANAKLAYEHALTLKPDQTAVLNNFAMSRMLAGDTTNARLLMTRAVASGSTDPKIALNLALLNIRAPIAAAAPTRPASRLASVAPAISQPVAAPPSQVISPVAAVVSQPMQAPLSRSAAVARNTVMPAAPKADAPAIPSVIHVSVPVIQIADAQALTRTSVPRARQTSTQFPSSVQTAYAPPTPIIRNGTRIIMQAVPFDPLAGPVANKAHSPAKPVKLAKSAPVRLHSTTPVALRMAADDAPKHTAVLSSVKHTAVAVPRKPTVAAPAPKPAKLAKAGILNHIPALRMTADAGKP